MFSDIDDDVFPIMGLIMAGLITISSLGVGVLTGDRDLAIAGITGGGALGSIAGTAHQANRKTTTRRSNNSTK
jgi:hypothetical protein